MHVPTDGEHGRLSRCAESIPPGAWLGLLGGGQLGRMFCMAAQSLGYQVARARSRRGTVPPAASPIATFAPTTSIRTASPQLAALAAAATTEFENVPGGRARVSSRAPRASTPGRRERRHRAGPDQREDLSVRARLRRRAVRGAARPRPTPAPRRCGARPGHREERAPRLRRQGTDPRARARRRRRGASARWAARRASSSSFVPLACEVSRDRRPRRRRRGRRVARRGEPASRRHPRRVDRPGARCPTSCAARRASRDRRRRAARLPRRALRRDVRHAPTARCSSTRSRRGRTTAATTRSTPASPSQFEQQARVLAGLPLGDARQHDAGGDGRTCSATSGSPTRRDSPARAGLDAGARGIRRRSCTSTARRSRGAAARWAT